MSCERIMPSSAVILVSDSNFFFVKREGKSVFGLVRDRATGVACYGIWERKLSKAESKLEDILCFTDALGVRDVMVILCLGQHDVLDCIKQERLGAAVSAIIALVEKHRNKLVVVELFDHTDFSASKEGYEKGVNMLNFLWKHEAWTDASLEVLSTSFIRDDLFLPDQVHLKPEGMDMLVSALLGKIRAFCLPGMCLS